MTLNQEQIKEIIPQREPFLFVDEMTELEPGKRGTGLWHLTGEEWFFKGHFPGKKITPGVLHHGGAGAGRRGRSSALIRTTDELRWACSAASKA